MFLGLLWFFGLRILALGGAYTVSGAIGTLVVVFAVWWDWKSSEIDSRQWWHKPIFLDSDACGKFHSGISCEICRLCFYLSVIIANIIMFVGAGYKIFTLLN